MKKNILIELIWLLGCLVASQISLKFLSNNTPLDINLHDTYFRGPWMNPVYPHFYTPFINFLFVGFFVYFLRCLYFEFKKIRIAFILLVFTSLALFFIDSILFLAISYEMEGHDVITDQVKGLFYGGVPIYHNGWIGGCLKIFLILLLSFTSFIIGRNWRKEKLKYQN